MLSYHTNLIQLSSLGLLRKSNKGGSTEDKNRNFAMGSPTELFFIFNLFGRRCISSTNWREEPEFFKGFPHRSLFYFFSTRLTPKSESAFNSASQPRGGVIWLRLKITLWKTAFLLRVLYFCERGYILIEIAGTLETIFYLVRYPNPHHN